MPLSFDCPYHTTRFSVATVHFYRKPANNELGWWSELEIAILGAQANALRAHLSFPVSAFSDAAECGARRWVLLALCDAPTAWAARALCCDTLLLPGCSNPAAVRAIAPGQAVGYGFSPRDTLTLSSLTSDRPLLCVQRSVLTLHGAWLQPQELPLPRRFAALPGEQALLLAGIELLCASAFE